MQREKIEQHFGCCRYIYNWALAEKIKAYKETGKSPHRFELQKQLLPMKKSEELKWLSDVNPHSLQNSLLNLESAYTNFFRRAKKGETSGFPKFKSKHKKQSYQCPDGSKVCFMSGTISLRRIKNIRCEFSRTFDGRIKTVTVSRVSSGKYFVSILVDTGIQEPIAPMPVKETAIGIDLGLIHFATLSTGEKIDNPRYLKKHLDKLKFLQRRGSRKVKGSNNRRKHNRRIASAYEKVSNCRQDFLHKLSTRLVRENQTDTICVEDLNISGMLSNHKLAQGISDVSWGEFMRQLEYKARWNGKNLIKCDRWDATSKTCSCGTVNIALKLSDRNWTCLACGITHDRDVLAANNVITMAFKKLKVPEGIGELTPVEIGALTSGLRSRKHSVI